MTLGGEGILVHDVFTTALSADFGTFLLLNSSIKLYSYSLSHTHTHTPHSFFHSNSFSVSEIFDVNGGREGVKS